MKAKVNMMFYERRGFHYLHKVFDLYRWIAGRPALIEHCAIKLLLDNGQDLVYHVGWRQNSKWVKATAYDKLNFIPLDSIYLGEVNIDQPELLRNIKSVRFGLFIYFFWYLFIRHISNWKPKNNCASKSIEILKLLGYEIDDTPIPIWLWDQLKEGEYDASNYDSGEGGIRKDYFG